MTPVVSIWFASTDAASLAACWSQLDADERRRADRFVRERDRRDYVVAHALLHDARASGRHHSLSHAPGLAMCAAADVEVGADVELIDPTIELPEIAAMLAPDERSGLDVDGFFTLWTLKEAYAKARGLGMALPFDRFTIELGEPPVVRGAPDWLVTSVTVPAPFRAAIAVKARSAELEVRW